MKLSIVIPIYNEAQTIAELIGKVVAVSLPGVEREIVCINDCSKDGTAPVLDQIPGRFPETDGTGDNHYNHRVYATTTSDFKTFTPTRLLYDGGFNVIDATMLHAEGKYYLIVKDETRNPPKNSNQAAECPAKRGIAVSRRLV